MDNQERDYFQWYYSLPTINKSVGILDTYRGGKVQNIDFCGECTVVWVEFKTMAKAFSYK